MQIEIAGKQVEVALYKSKEIKEFDSSIITISDLSKDKRYYGISEIDGKEYFLKFVSEIWPHEVNRLKLFDDSLYTPKFYCVEKIEGWEILVTERCPGAMLTSDNVISIDDGIFILDQLVNFLKQLYSEKLIIDGRYCGDIANPENFIWDKKKRQLYFVDFGPGGGESLFKDLIKHFLRILELRCGAINSTIFENFIDQYFDLLYDQSSKDISWVIDFRKRCNDYHSGQPYQTIRITKDYYMEGARAIQPRLRLLNLGNLYSKTVLDLGCNLGGFCIDAKRRHAKVAIGYDIDEPIILFGMELADFLSLETLLYHAELSELTVERVYQDSGVDVFDNVFFFSSWPYVKDKIKFIKFLKELNFKTMYWEFNMFTPVKMCEQILKNSEVFEKYEFLGYTDIYKGKLNARALYKCIKRKKV